MLMFNIIMVVCLIPIWPILFFMIRNYAKPKKLIILGATLPQSAHEDAAVLAQVESFKKWLNITMLPLLPLSIAPFFMTSIGAAMTWYMVWLVLILVFPFLVFAIHRGRLINLKRENNWYSESLNQTLAEVKAAGVPVLRISNFWFLIPVILSMLPVIYMLLNPGEIIMASIYISFAVTTLLFWPFYHLIFRQRPEIVNENLTLTMALTRVRRYNWGKFWVIATWSTGILNLLLWVFESKPIAFLWLTLGYTVLVLIISIYTEFATRRAQQRLTSGDIGDIYLDEDDYWIGGFLYSNPNDSHFMINNRVGMGMTVNLAKTAGKIIMGFAALSIIAMPFIGVWIWIEEATPVRLVLSDRYLTVRHTTDVYVISLSAIESIELIENSEDLPKINARTNGMSSTNINKGTFSIFRVGSTFLCMHPENPPFLIIFADGQPYILNDFDSTVTRAVYSAVHK